MSTVDLKDAYLSVPIAEEHRKFLRLSWEGKTFQFTCLPFGLCTAPRVFTKLLRPIMAHLHQQGIRSVIYLDDLLLMAQRKDLLISHVAQTVHLLEQLGFLVNQEKSQLSPSQQATYLGFVINSQEMKLYLPQTKLTQVVECCRKTLGQTSLSVREVAKVVGVLSATRPAVLPAPLYYRHVQHLAIRSLKQPTWFDTRVTLDASARQDLEWWIYHITEWNGRSMLPVVPETTMETDASKLGWGATCEGSRTGHLRRGSCISNTWSYKQGPLQ